MKKRTMLFADEGMWLTDGTNYGKTMVLAEGASVKSYTEVTDEEYRAEMAKIEEAAL